MEGVLLVLNIVFLLLGIIHRSTKDSGFDASSMDGLIVTLVAVATVYIFFNFLADLQAHYKTVSAKKDSHSDQSDDDNSGYLPNSPSTPKEYSKENSNNNNNNSSANISLMNLPISSQKSYEMSNM